MRGIDRREFIRQTALAAAASSAAALVPGIAFAEEIGDDRERRLLEWHKTPCRFCGVGCGLLVAIEEGRAVAVRGDPDSPVNRGLACVKGYHSVQALYGADRIRKAMVRRGGELVEVPLQEALDLVAERLGDAASEHGLSSVAIYGSGQWTIPDGYVASKLFKGAIGTNNVEANARLCMASAVTGFATTFGLDEPMGCYEDIDHADVFVLWGNNMAEAHPVLFSRMLERRRAHPEVRIVDLATRTTRTSLAADRSLAFAPHADLAIANAICHELVRNGWVDRDFVDHHVAFKSGRTGIGYGLSDEAPFAEEAVDVTWDDFVDFVEEYTPERAEEISGLPAGDIRWLASLYGDPSLRVMSLWCMGVNQHTRGTWMNNLIYNIHLLAGKVATPGNSPFSLTGQPSACGTVREVGTLTHALPGGRVTDPAARARAAEIWGVPEEAHPRDADAPHRLHVPGDRTGRDPFPLGAGEQPARFTACTESIPGRDRR